LLTTFPAVKIPRIPKMKGINISDVILPRKNPIETTIKQSTEMINLVEVKFGFIFIVN